MDGLNYETSYFRYCRRFDGTLEPVDVAKRNGRLVPRFPPSVVEADPQIGSEDSAEYRELLEEVCQNLNDIERRTWLRILDKIPILEIAEEDKVTRAAIYDRLRRMVAKNDYVAIWWRLKNKVNQHQ